MSCLTFGLLGPFLLIYREGIDLSENGMFRDIFLFNQEIEEDDNTLKDKTSLPPSKPPNYFKKVFFLNDFLSTWLLKFCPIVFFLKFGGFFKIFRPNPNRPKSKCW